MSKAVAHQAITRNLQLRCFKRVFEHHGILSHPKLRHLRVYGLLLTVRATTGRIGPPAATEMSTRRNPRLWVLPPRDGQPVDWPRRERCRDVHQARKLGNGDGREAFPSQLFRACSESLRT
jgi:hypothetical protein